MSAIGITEAPRFGVVRGEKQRGVGALDGVCIEELVDRAQKKFGFCQDESALTAQVGLKVGHKQSGGDAFARDISNHEPEALLSEIEKVKVVSTDLSSLQAETGIFERFHLRMHLRKKSSLHLLGDLNFLGGAAFGLTLPGQNLAFGLYPASEFVEPGKSERVPIRIFKAGVNAAPRRNLRRETESNSARPPFIVFAVHVFGD